MTGSTLTVVTAGIEAAARALVSGAPEVIVRDRVLVCPTCGTVPGEWVELDMALRWNRGEGITEGLPVLAIRQCDPEFHTVAFACGDCDGLAFVPEYIEVTWG